MAEGQTLDEMLRPEEQVLHGAPASWKPRHWDGLLVFLPVCIACAVGGFVLSGELDFDLVTTLGMAGGLAVFLTGYIGTGLWGLSSHEVALTDQRLFHNPSHRKPRIADLELAEIQRVEISDCALAVTKTDGLSHVVSHGRDIQELGAALCGAFGVAPPPAPRRRERLAQGLFAGVVAGAGLAAACALFAGLTGDAGFGVWALALYGLAVAPVGLGAALAGGLVMLLALRPVLTRLEMERLALPDRVDFQAPGAAGRRGLAARLFLRVVDLLYKAPIQAEPEGLGSGA